MACLASSGVPPFFDNLVVVGFALDLQQGIIAREFAYQTSNAVSESGISLNCLANDSRSLSNLFFASLSAIGKRTCFLVSA